MNEIVLAVSDLGKRFSMLDREGGILPVLKFVLGGRLRWSDEWALDSVGFSLRRGEMLGLVGRNGSGKSTLLRLLAGIYPPTKGRIEFSGARTASVLELTSGVRSELTGLDNLRTLLFIANPGLADHQRPLEWAAAFSGLGARLDEPCRGYSTGMLLRLGFAASVAVRPDLLLLDEVMAVGDRSFQSACVRRINEFRSAGTAVVLASHDLDLVSRWCSVCLWLEEGRVAAFGRTGMVLGRYREFLACTGPALTHPGGSRSDADDGSPSGGGTECNVTTPDGGWAAVESPVSSVTIAPARRYATHFELDQGTAFELRVDFDTSSRACAGCGKGLSLGVALKRADGLLLWGGNTAREGLSMQDSACRVILELPGGELPPGDYSFDLCLADASEKPVWYGGDAVRLSVSEAGRPPSEGIIVPAHRFRIERAGTGGGVDGGRSHGGRP